MAIVPSSFRRVIVAGLAPSALDLQMMRGIHLFRHEESFWRLHDAGHGLEQFDFLLQKAFVYDGVIANITTPHTLQRLRELGLPVVDVSGITEQSEFPVVEPDHIAIGREAAAYFLNRGFEHFIYHSPGDRSFERKRWEGFRDALAAAGKQATWVINATQRILGMDNNDLCPPGMEGFSRWLERAPKPVALLAAWDGVGVGMCDMAFEDGLSVPEQVAVLGVDNSVPICESSYPPLSSVRLPGEQIGLAAARLLSAMMDGQPIAPVKPLGPLGVETRRSTDVLAMRDQLVARAIAYLHEHAREKIAIDDVAAHVKINRRTLEKKFKTQLGRSPLNELYRLRVELACRRLVETEASVYVTAVESGFRDAETMALHFKRQLGITPSAYRKQARAG